MNTLRDTDEGRARPSVWPVYVAAAVILAFSLVLFVLFVLEVVLHSFHILQIIQPAYGLFGIVTAAGIIPLRPWGWWCALVWTIIFGVVVAVSTGLMLQERLVPTGEILVRLAIIGLLIWPLATRRRLFFPRV